MKFQTAESMKQFTAYIAVLVTMMLWGISFVWTRSLFDAGLNPLFVMTVRLFLSGGLLYAVLKPLGRLNKIARGDVKWFLALAFFEPFLYFFGDNYGVLWTSASMASVFIATIPIFVPLAMHLVYKEPVRATNIIGVLVSLSGIAVMVLNNRMQLVADVRGLAALAVAVFASVSYSVLLAKMMTKYSAYTITTYQNIIGFLYYLPLFLAFDLSHSLSVSFTGRMILDLFLLAVFCSAVAFILYTYTAHKIGVTKTSVFANLIPVFTVVFAVTLGQETFDMRKFIGMLLVIGGVILSQISFSKPVSKACKTQK